MSQPVANLFTVWDTSAPQPDCYLARKLLFPLVTRWDQLFGVMTYEKTDAPEPYVVDTPFYSTLDRRRGPMTIGPYCIIRAGGSVWVRPHQVVAEAIALNTIALPGDSIYFEVIHWSDERALVVATHSLILGTSWLAVIDPSTILSLPRPVSHQATP